MSNAPGYGPIEAAFSGAFAFLLDFNALSEIDPFQIGLAVAVLFGVVVGAAVAARNWRVKRAARAGHQSVTVDDLKQRR